MRRHRAILGACAALLAALAALPAAAMAQAQNQAPNQDYVAMGDSYSSGNGTGDYYEDTCYRSVKAYGPLIDPQIPGSFSHPACSGARTNHIDLNTQNGFPKQIDLLGANTDYVSLSIGGNDAGFTDALQQCAIPFGGCTDSGGELDQAEAFIQGQLPALLDRNFAAIRQRAPNATVSVLGYPRIFRPNETCIAVFSTAEVNRANQLADQLADVTRERALAAGFSFVDARQAFLGHGSCDSANWINEFSVSDVVGSFHPTANGYSADAGLVRATLLAARHPSETTGPNGRLAFTSSRDGNAEIYAMNGNGDFPQNVSNAAGAADVDPAWSPDGTKLAFTSNRDGDNDIYVLDWASGSLTNLTANTADDGEPAWSPNGDWIVFRSSRDGDNDIWKMTATGGSATDLTSFSNDVHNDTAPAWSPDGSEIAFRRASSGGNGEVFRMNSDGQGHANLTNNGAEDGAPSWSPDGRTIAFHSTRDGNFEIYTMTRGGASVARRTNDAGADKDPTYAPSGSGIAFASTRDGNEEIYTASATGGSPVRRTTVAQGDGAPSWQGDGTPPQTTIGSGPSGSTSQRQPQFGFSANELGSSFQCRVDGGSWSSCGTPFTTAILGNGPHTFEVRAVDPAGNADPSPASRSFDVNPTSGTSITAGPAGITNDRTPEFSFESTVAGTTFECSVDGGPFAPCSAPFTAPELGDGPHTFAVRGIAPGNQVGDPVSSDFTVDATAPQTTIDFEPPAAGSDPRPSFEFSSSEPGSSFECRLDSADPGDWGACSSPFETGSLTDGAHTFDVRAVDAAGNRDGSPEHRGFAIDTTAPATTIDPIPARVTTPSIEVTFAAGESATYECRFDSADEADWEPCNSPLSSPELQDGPHSFEVRATDDVGNVEPAPARAEFSVDATAPDTFIDSDPHGRTNVRKPAFTFSSDDLDPTFQCAIDGGGWVPCSQEYASLSNLAEGEHTFTVRALDEFGNPDPDPASESFEVDVTRPGRPAITGPLDFNDQKSTNDRTPTFTLTPAEDPAIDPEDGVTLECRLDQTSQDAWQPCSSPYTTPELSAGGHRLDVRGLDAAGNVSAAQDVAVWAFDVDLTAPAVTGLTRNVPDPTNSRSAIVKFGADEPGARFECKLDDGGWSGCSSPWTLSGLTDGGHTARVVALDPAGNRTSPPAMTAFTVDATAPETTIAAGPSGPTREARPSFRFGANEAAAFECRTDGGSWRACRSGEPVGPLSDGAHTFEVRGIDALRNVDGTPASRSFTVDTQVAAPVVEAPKSVKAPGGKLSIPLTVSAGEATDVSVTGTVAAGSSRVPLPPRSISLLSRARGELRLAPAKAGAKTLKKALRKRKPLKATIAIAFTDGLGNSATVQRTVKVSGKR